MHYIIIGLVLAFAGYYVLYMVIKAAVRDGIKEANLESIPAQKQDSMLLAVCTQCNRQHEIDDPKCPHCGHVKMEL